MLCVKLFIYYKFLKVTIYATILYYSLLIPDSKYFWEKYNKLSPESNFISLEFIGYCIFFETLSVVRKTRFHLFYKTHKGELTTTLMKDICDCSPSHDTPFCKDCKCHQGTIFNIIQITVKFKWFDTIT